MELELSEREAGIIAGALGMFYEGDDPNEAILCAKIGRCAPPHLCRKCTDNVHWKEVEATIEKFILLVEEKV